jgi:hypothetical protein
MKLSAVVQLIDGFSGRPAVGVLACFELDGHAYQPLAKAQAFYAFVDLADGTHHLKITCPGFFDSKATVNSMSGPLAAPLADEIVVCTLEPSPLYAYPSDTTLIRGRVIDGRNNKRPLAGVLVDGDYVGARGATNSETRTYGKGAYDGRYALALPGNFVGESVSVELRFVKEGYASVTWPVSLERGTVKFFDVEMQ